MNYKITYEYIVEAANEDRAVSEGLTLLTFIHDRYKDGDVIIKDVEAME